MNNSYQLCIHTKNSNINNKTIFGAHLKINNRYKICIVSYMKSV